MEDDFKSTISNFRAKIKESAQELLEVREIKKVSESNAVEDPAEVLANMTLAYRHLEDAAMRLGKVIQAYDGGISVYDK